MVALDKMSGRTVWQAPSTGDLAGYASPSLGEFAGRRIIFTMNAKAVIGVDADTGELLFRHEHQTAYDVNVQMPIFRDGHVFISTGYGSGAKLLRLVPAGGSSTWNWCGTSEASTTITAVCSTWTGSFTVPTTAVSGCAFALPRGDYVPACGRGERFAHLRRWDALRAERAGSSRPCGGHPVSTPRGEPVPTAAGRNGPLVGTSGGHWRDAVHPSR